MCSCYFLPGSGFDFVPDLKFFEMASSKNDLDFEPLWKELKAGLESIFSKNMSRHSFLRLYGLVYKCQDDSANSQLYINLTSFLREHVQTIYNKLEDLTNEPLLTLYAESWENYRSSSKLFDEILAPFNRNWVKREKKCMKRNYVFEAYQLSLLSWKDNLMELLIDRLSDALLHLIAKERNGEIISPRLISITLDSYIEMGINNGKIFSKRFYMESFEKKFLDETESFYCNKSTTFLRTNSVLKFIRQIKDWFKEEHKRTQLYLHKSTLDKLMRMEHLLLIKHMYLIQSKFKTLCKKPEDLSRIRQLLSRFTGVLDEFKIQFQEFVTTEGLLAIEKCQSNAEDHESYINTILEVCENFNCIVSTCFESEAGFVPVFEKACEKFINRNAVTENIGSSNKSAEFLIRYIDTLLKMRSTCSEKVEMTEKLNRAMNIFKYIENKDMFEGFYSKLLVERFFQQTNVSSNNVTEKSMMSKMKEMCKYEYAAQFQVMVQDVMASQDINDQFEKETGSLNDFTISVISSSFWSFSSPLPLPLPHELEQSVHQFTAFYNSRVSGRKLIWLHNISRGEIVSSCFDKKYNFEASTFQMAVLLQFNKRTKLSFQQLQKCTGLESDTLLQLLQGLAKCKLLKESDSNPITKTSWIMLNDSYQNEGTDVNIKVPMKTDKERMDHHVKKARRFSIQAAIVKIAKVRKVIKHETLVMEVINQLSARFKPRVSVINKTINYLIEKEYIRKGKEEDTYRYIT